MEWYEDMVAGGQWRGSGYWEGERKSESEVVKILCFVEEGIRFVSFSNSFPPFFLKAFFSSF